MITIELITTDYFYSPIYEITLRTNIEKWEAKDIEGTRIDNRMTFELSEEDYEKGFEFKFVINRKFWSIGSNLKISGEEIKSNKKYEYYLNDFEFKLPAHDAYRIDYVHVNEEYRALRAEIQRRSQDQQNIVNISLLSIGALVAAWAAIVDSDQLPEGSKLLLNSLLVIGPWIFLNLGILWCDHDKSIHNIGIYIRNVLENRCFPSITPNLNFPAIVDKNINSYKDIFSEKTKKLDESEQREYYNKLKSVSLGWENTHKILVNNSPKKILILPNIFPFIYFFLPSVLLILVYLFKDIDFYSFSFANFRNFYLPSWQEFLKFFPIFLLEWVPFLVPFLVDLYLLYVFWTYWQQSIQTRNTLFWNENLKQ